MAREPRLRWTPDELDTLREHYPRIGATAIEALLPGRSHAAIIQKAMLFDVRDPTGRPTAALRPPLGGKDLDRAVKLRRDGWSYARIAAEFDVCESSATNAILVAECRAAGFTPARRDASGAVMARDVKRMRAMMMQGLRGVEIQRQLGLSASCISNHRRKFLAELKRRRRGKTLPPPGGDAAYSGRKLAPALKRQAEQLFMEGYGSQKVHNRTGISITQVGRIRNRLVERLRRRGECLPGCDANGLRRKQLDSARFVKPELITALREQLLARVPVARAARIVGIGSCRAYKERHRYASELAAEGKVLPPPLLPGKGARKLVAQSRWLPKDKLYRYRELCRSMPPAEAKAAVLAEVAAVRKAEAARPKTFEEQLERVRRGARLIEIIPIRTVPPAITLGGVGSAMI